MRMPKKATKFTNSDCANALVVRWTSSCTQMTTKVSPCEFVPNVGWNTISAAATSTGATQSRINGSALSAIPRSVILAWGFRSIQNLRRQSNRYTLATDVPGAVCSAALPVGRWARTTLPICSIKRRSGITTACTRAAAGSCPELQVYSRVDRALLCSGWTSIHRSGSLLSDGALSKNSSDA